MYRLACAAATSLINSFLQYDVICNTQVHYRALQVACPVKLFVQQSLTNIWNAD